MIENWDKCQEIMSKFERIYAMDIDQQAIVYKYALRVPKGGLMLEIGVCGGTTGAAMGYAAKQVGARYIGIDNFSLIGKEMEIRQNFKNTGFPCEIIKADSQTYGWAEPLDLLVIDGDHSAGVQHDCRIYIPWVKPGGIVMFHDFDKWRNVDHAHQYIWIFGDAATKGWEEVDFLNGLMVKQRPS